MNSSAPLIIDKKPGRKEFVALMALMTSIVALAIDGMLPALPQIGQDFSAPESELPLIVSVLFLGFGFGNLVFGPLSDVFGRKPPIYAGIVFFMIGAILSGFAVNMPMLLLGRALQGFGGASPRIVSLALIRDEYSGNAMAQIMSLVMSVFIIVPAIAPSLGQGILFFAEWRAIFILLFVVAAIIWAWFGLRQHETLPKEKRRRFTFDQIKFGIKETFTQPTTISCMIISGLVFGIFVGYLGAVQGIFDKIFHMGELFPMFFAILAVSLGGASVFNARFVLKLGMRRLITYAFAAMALISNLFTLYLIFFQTGHPPLWLFMSYMILTFFSVGFLFGNLNSMAMEPLGHVAGIGSALLGFMQSTISVILGSILGVYFHSSITPLAMSFGIVSLICLLILFLEERYFNKNSELSN